MLKAPYLVAGLAVAAGGAVAQRPPWCLLPDGLMLAAEMTLDTATARAACGRDEPEVGAAARAFADDVIAIATRIIGAQHEPILREHLDTFAAARARGYRDDIAGRMAAGCREDRWLAAPSTEIAALIEDSRERLRQAAPGLAARAQPDCRDP